MLNKISNLILSLYCRVNLSLPGRDMFRLCSVGRSLSLLGSDILFPDSDTMYFFSAIRELVKIHFQQKPSISLRVSAMRGNPHAKVGFRQRCGCKGGCKTRVCNCVKRGASCHSGCRCYNGKPCENDRHGCPYECKFNGCHFDGLFAVVKEHELTCKHKPKRGRVGGRVQYTG